MRAIAARANDPSWATRCLLLFVGHKPGGAPFGGAGMSAGGFMPTEQ